MRPWKTDTRGCVHLFADARSAPPHIAAVLLIDGLCLFCDMPAPEAIVTSFRTRGDKHIMSLELLSIALGLSSFASMLRGRKVRIWSDNTGAESCTRKGSARSFDHACLVHSMWLHAACLGCNLRVDRVPTAENIADLPSREDYTLLASLGAERVEARLEKRYWMPETWEALSLKSVVSKAIGASRFTCDFYQRGHHIVRFVRKDRNR